MAMGDMILSDGYDNRLKLVTEQRNSTMLGSTHWNRVLLQLQGPSMSTASTARDLFLHETRMAYHCPGLRDPAVFNTWIGAPIGLKVLDSPLGNILSKNHSTYDPGYIRGSSTARAVRTPRHRRPQQPNYIPPRPAQPVTPHYDPQPPAVCIRCYSNPVRFLRQVQQDGLRNITPPHFEHGNDAYWGNSVNGFNHDTRTPPPWNGGEYPPYGHFGQGGINQTGFPFMAEPLSNFPTNLSHPFPGTSAAPGNQGVYPVWMLSDCGVVYEAQDELRLTIVFKKVPFA
ncbi:hypothetical protein EDB83DRAFT_2313899 [Lactarius deliciosus]|nr:hypothetical protein EDB83DRAFT_2313899 [Lactarius deliciosus]